MIEFLKNILKNVNFKSNNEELNNFNKVIYSIIILCAVVFIGAIVFFSIKNLPSFIDAVRYNWNESKTMLNGFKN